jgi:hypothetical protein
MRNSIISKNLFKFSLSILCLGLTTAAFALDHDADAKSDLIVYRPTDPGFGNAIWFVNSSALAGTLVYQWGLLGDTPIQGNFTGAAGADLAVYRPSQGNWFIRNYSTDLKFNTASKVYQWGFAGDTPISCDFDGDSGRSDLTVYRPSNGTWYTRKSGASTAFEDASIQQWGGFSGDRPVAKDFDADNKCDHTIYRSGNWFVVLSSTSGTEAAIIPWGSAGDVPVAGKYDNDSITDFAVYRPSNSTWYVRRSNLAGLTSRTIKWGNTGDIPVPADYTGDGKTDIAVWRPTTATWFILTSESNYTASSVRQFGLPGDSPMADTRGSL